MFPKGQVGGAEVCFRVQFLIKAVIIAPSRAAPEPLKTVLDPFSAADGVIESIVA